MLKNMRPFKYTWNSKGGIVIKEPSLFISGQSDIPTLGSIIDDNTPYVEFTSNINLQENVKLSAPKANTSLLVETFE